MERVKVGGMVDGRIKGSIAELFVKSLVGLHTSGRELDKVLMISELEGIETRKGIIEVLGKYVEFVEKAPE